VVISVTFDVREIDRDGEGLKWRVGRNGSEGRSNKTLRHKTRPSCLPSRLSCFRMLSEGFVFFVPGSSYENLSLVFPFVASDVSYFSRAFKKLSVLGERHSTARAMATCGSVA